MRIRLGDKTTIPLSPQLLENSAFLKEMSEVFHDEDELPLPPFDREYVELISDLLTMSKLTRDSILRELNFRDLAALALISHHLAIPPVEEWITAKLHECTVGRDHRQLSYLLGGGWTSGDEYAGAVREMGWALA